MVNILTKEEASFFSKNLYMVESDIYIIDSDISRARIYLKII